jgi:hypothetical protein
MLSSISFLFLVAEHSSCLLGCVSIRYIIRKESFIILIMQVQRKGEFIETSLVDFFRRRFFVVIQMFVLTFLSKLLFSSSALKFECAGKMPSRLGFILAVFLYFLLMCTIIINQKK